MVVQASPPSRRSWVPVLLMVFVVAITVGSAAWMVVLVLAASASSEQAMCILAALGVGTLALLAPTAILARLRRTDRS